jgi:hypothetical protein
MRYRIKVGDIGRVRRNLNRTRYSVFRAQSKYLEDQYETIYRTTYSTTMVATGELRKALFKKSSMHTAGFFKCECGYNPTENNQSVSQEFDDDKRVHRVVTSHYKKTKNGMSPRCSRHPNDLYTIHGKEYEANPSARRGALAYSVKKVFSAPNVAVFKTGGGFLYAPDLSKMIWRMASMARVIVGG